MLRERDRVQVAKNKRQSERAILLAFELVPGERKATTWKKYFFRAIELWLGKTEGTFCPFQPC